MVISVWKWAGRRKNFHMGTPRFQIEFVPIWGPTYILYDLICSVLLKNSTHSLSYKACHCFTVFFTGDWLVTHWWITLHPLWSHCNGAKYSYQVLLLVQLQGIPIEPFEVVYWAICNISTPQVIQITIIYGDLGHLWSQNDVIMSWLRLSSYSNCSPHPY